MDAESLLGAQSSELTAAQPAEELVIDYVPDQHKYSHLRYLFSILWYSPRHGAGSAALQMPWPGLLSTARLARSEWRRVGRSDEVVRCEVVW